MSTTPPFLTYRMLSSIPPPPTQTVVVFVSGQF